MDTKLIETGAVCSDKLTGNSNGVSQSCEMVYIYGKIYTTFDFSISFSDFNFFTFSKRKYFFAFSEFTVRTWHTNMDYRPGFPRKN